jgi:hypothetical protein
MTDSTLAWNAALSRWDPQTMYSWDWVGDEAPSSPSSFWISPSRATMTPKMSPLATDGLTTRRAIHAGELRRHCAGAMVHVDYGNPTYPPFQVMLPGIGDDGSTPLRNTWGYYLLTGPGTTPLSGSLTGARRLFDFIRSPIKWDDPYAFGNVQPNYLAHKYGIKLLGGVDVPGNELTALARIQGGYLGPVTILGESFPALTPPQVFEGLECANEPGFNDAALSLQVARVRDYMRSNSAWDTVPIVLPSLLNPADIATWGDQRTHGGGRTATMASNPHPYAGGYPPDAGDPDGDRAVYALQWQQGAPGQPIWATECGYHNTETTTNPHPGVSVAVAHASYTIRMLLNNAWTWPRGSRSIVYQLVEAFGVHDPNNGETTFGLIDTTTNPWTPKPAYGALRALLLSMEDGDALGDGAVPFAFSGGVGSTQVVPVFFSDGRFGAWLWDSRMIYNRDTHTAIPVADTSLSVVVPAGVGGVYQVDPIATGTTRATLTPAGGAVTVACSATNPKLVVMTP